MNLTPAFIRKVLYFTAMIPPLVIIGFLGQPSVRSSDGKSVEQGGQLAQMRINNDLAQANLGEIDPAGETMKLSTLGLRGVAVNQLWMKAMHYKKVKDFDRLSATVNQIVKLQPNFITVREFQAHNLSYNVSVEFDDYRDRYHWVTKGIDFLMEGTQYNRNEPHLMKECGWFVSQKIGRSDEFKQFRRLFRLDNEFHTRLNQFVSVDDAKSRADLRPDNWLVGRLWYLKAERLVETKNIRTRENPWLFFSHAPRCLISYGSALDRDGELPQEEVAQQAWRDAEKEWELYGRREFYTDGEPIRLNMLMDLRIRCNALTAAIDAAASGMSREQVEQVRAEAARLFVADPRVEQVHAKLKVKFPGYDRRRDEIRRHKREALSEEQRNALETDPDLRTTEQQSLAVNAEYVIEPNHNDMLEGASKETKPLVESLVEEFVLANDERGRAETLDSHSKYHYWLIRCQVESTEEARAAKRHLFQARQLASQARLEKETTINEAGEEVVTLGAKEHYEAAWDLWHNIFERRPEMYDNVEESQMLMQDLLEYDRVLSKLDLPPLPHDFKMRGLIDFEAELWEGRPIQPAPEEEPDAEKPDSEKPDSENASTGGKAQPAESPEAAKPEVGKSAEAKGADDEKAKPAAESDSTSGDSGKPATADQTTPEVQQEGDGAAPPAKKNAGENVPREKSDDDASSEKPSADKTSPEAKPASPDSPN